MNTIVTKIQRFGKIRQLHTILSQETVKPSSPTPPHLKIHNLLLNDILVPDIHLPFIFFYQNCNTNNGGINILKKSLSQCLTQYYPFAGRFLTPSAACVECSDQGVAFLEASIDSRLVDFIYDIENNKTLDQLTPNAFIYAIDQKTSQNIAAVQLTHFTCGGAAIAVSISHKVADAFTVLHFVNHWASVTRGGSLINPTFFSSSITNPGKLELSLEKRARILEYETRKFVFPNTKLNELKNKVNAMSAHPLNPSRVELLTSMIFRCATLASRTKSGSSEPSTLIHAVNTRRNMGTDLPKIAAGNFFGLVTVKTSAVKLNELIISLRKEITQVRRIRDVMELGKRFENTLLALKTDHLYSFSAVCNLPFYQVDFGWGKPVRVVIQTGIIKTNGIVFMDTPCEDGIEATVQLEKEDMAIFQKDKELLQYVEDI